MRSEESLKFFETVSFKEEIHIDQNLSFHFQYAGHILGAASVIMNAGGKKIAFTGDAGRMEDRIFYSPDLLPHSDYLITESTYGNKLHDPTRDPKDDLEKIVNETIQRNGAIIIPAFAVGRAQAIMYYLSQLRRENRIPKIPMFLNSPMATSFNEVFCKYKKLHKLSLDECNHIDDVMTFVQNPEESKALNERKGPLLIISASGMITGGRVLHHLKAFAPFPQNTILLTGYQSAGTRGEALEKGSKEIKIHGEYVPVNAQVKVLDNMSAHADYRELIDWFEKSKINPRKVFITHGESSASDEFRRRIEEKFNWNCKIPEYNEKIILE